MLAKDTIQGIHIHITQPDIFYYIVSFGSYVSLSILIQCSRNCCDTEQIGVKALECITPANIVGVSLRLYIFQLIMDSWVRYLVIDYELLCNFWFQQ